MNDLSEWLEQQNGGIRTYTEFQRKAYVLARENSADAALLALLGGVAARFAARFEGEPLSVDDAAEAITQFKRILHKAITVAAGNVTEKMDFANDIATYDLLDARSQ